MDVIIGGLILGIGMTVVLSASSRSLARQVDAEHQLVASWLADELLSMVLVEGPDVYPRLYDMAGSFEEPFERFDYELDIDDEGPWQPYRVIAVIRWPAGGGWHQVQVETSIAHRRGEPIEPELREPLEPLDRDARYFDEEEDDEEL
jgi:hypothetical protein